MRLILEYRKKEAKYLTNLVIITERTSNMQPMLIITVIILLTLVYLKQKRIYEFENDYYEVMKMTCESLGLIKEGLTVEEILQLGDMD